MVVVTPAIQQAVPVYKELIGRTVAANTVDIKSQVTGTVLEATFAEGQRVSNGQLLFLIDPRQYEASLRLAQAAVVKAHADVAQAEAALNKNQQDVARYAPLVAQHAIPREQYEDALAAVKTAQAQVQQAEAGVKQQEANVRQAELNLSYTQIRSPLDGIAGVRHVDPGNLVAANSASLVTISSVNPMEVDFDITETDYLRFIQRYSNPNQRTRVAGGIRYTLLLPDGVVYPYRGRFVLVERAVNPQTGTLTIRVEFPNPQSVLRPGQFVRIRYTTEQIPNAVLVPQEAIQELQGVQSVLVVNPRGKVEQHTVQTAGAWKNYAIVTGGVVPGQEVIVAGGQKVRPGMTVRTERR